MHKKTAREESHTIASAESPAKSTHSTSEATKRGSVDSVAFTSAALCWPKTPTHSASWQVWVSECGRYQVGRYEDDGAGYFIACHGVRGKWSEFVELSPKNIGNHPKRYTMLEDCLKSCERHLAKQLKIPVVESNLSEVLPAKVEKSKEKVSRRTSGGSNKERVYKLWLTDERNVTTLLAATDGGVAETTVKAWLSAWKRGQNLPACAR